MTYLALLRRNRNYAKLWLSEAISMLGDWFNTIVLVAIVAKISDGSGLAVSGFMLARTIPPFLIGPYAGVLADRHNRKHLMIVSDVLRVFVVLMFVIAIRNDMLWFIYILTILQFSLTAIFTPAKSAILPIVVEHDDLVVANTFGSITWSVMLAVGAVIGGLVAGIFGVMIALVIDAMTFALSALLVMSIDITDNRAVATESRTDNRGFMDGMRYLRQHPDIAVILVAKGGRVIADISTIMAIFATGKFIIGENGEQSLSIFYTAAGIGAVLGPVILNHFNDGSVYVMRRLLLIGFMMNTMAWLLMGWANSLVLFSLVIMLHSMGGSTNWTFSSVIIQKTAADDYLGRVFSIDNTIFQMAVMLATITTGALIDLIGIAHISQLIMVFGMISIIPTVAWWLAIQWLEKRQHALQIA